MLPSVVKSRDAVALSTSENEVRRSLLDEDFLHGGDGRPEAFDAEFLAVLLEYVEQLLEAGAALVRQKVVQLGGDARLLLHVWNELANDSRDVLLFAFAVLHQRQVISNSFTRAYCSRNLGVL